MPPSSASTLFRRSEGLTKLQLSLRRSFAHACAVDSFSTNKAEGPVGSQNAAELQSPVHAASSSRGTSTHSQDPMLDIAQSVEHRLRLLQQEHIDSQLHRSSHAEHYHADQLVREDKGGLDQQHMEAQWARYKEHRAAADQYAPQRQTDLHGASLDSRLVSDDGVWQEASDGEEYEGKMQQLRKLLDSPLSSVADNMGLQEEGVDEGTEQDSRILREPDARTAKRQPAPRTMHHTSVGSALLKVGSQGRQADVVPVHSQQLLQTGIVGVPNSGKSTLTNALVGQKVTAVSDKTNTTGAARLGAFTEGKSQVALYDTPGVVHTRSLHGPRHARSVRSAWGTASQCDVLMCIVDAHRQILKPDIRVYGLVEELASGPLPSWTPLPTVLILNKVDLLSKEQGVPLLQLRDRFLQMFPFQDVFCISARHGAGVQELKQYLLERCKPGKWIVRPWEATDMGPSEIATELVRENLFKRLYKEVPYNLDILDVSTKHLRDGSFRIEKHIMVPSEQIRAIVVGTKGAAIGEIGIAARKNLEVLLGHRVHLILNVKERRQLPWVLPAAQSRQTDSGEGPGYRAAGPMGDPNAIAKAFQEHYYNTFDTNRQALAGLYKDDAFLSFEGQTVQGAQAITQKLTSLPFQQVKHHISSTDAQPSTCGGLLVFVTGQILTEGESNPLKFSQMFHLAPQGGSFVVTNDIFRLNLS